MAETSSSAVKKSSRKYGPLFWWIALLGFYVYLTFIFTAGGLIYVYVLHSFAADIPPQPIPASLQRNLPDVPASENGLLILREAVANDDVFVDLEEVADADLVEAYRYGEIEWLPPETVKAWLAANEPAIELIESAFNAPYYFEPEGLSFETLAPEIDLIHAIIELKHQTLGAVELDGSLKIRTLDCLLDIEQTVTSAGTLMSFLTGMSARFKSNEGSLRLLSDTSDLEMLAVLEARLLSNVPPTDALIAALKGRHSVIRDFLRKSKSKQFELLDDWHRSGLDIETKFKFKLSYKPHVTMRYGTIISKSIYQRSNRH
ncbi:MAG: hypothetical protein ACFBZ8_08005 [Opitutales bacterium]